MVCDCNFLKKMTSIQIDIDRHVTSMFVDIRESQLFCHSFNITLYWFHYLTITIYLSGQNQNLAPFIFSCACLYYPMLHKSLHFNLHSYVLYWCWDCQISRRFKFNVICHCQQKMNLEQCSENRKCCWIKFLKDGMGWSFHIKLKAHLKFLKRGKIILVTFSLGSSSKANFSFIV